MSSILLVLGRTALIFFVAFEISSYATYGKMISDNKIPNLDDYVLNTVNPSIMLNHKVNYGRFYITDSPFPLLSKYHVSGIGRVPRWSDGHKQIERKFEELNNKF